MTSIVRYGSGPVYRYASPFTKAQAAYKVGQFIYNNRAKLRAMYRWNKRKRRSALKYRASKRKRMRLVGMRPGSGLTKKYPIRNQTSLVNKATRTLYSVDVTDIAKQSTEQINRRDRDIVNLRGFKWCQEWRNILNTPLLCNWAVVTPRKGDIVETADFFRAANEDARVAAFGTARSSNESHCLPINSDAYVVHAHKRFILGPANGQTNTSWYFPNHKNYIQLKKYVKINRQIRFEDTSTPTTRGVFVVYWMDQTLQPGGAAAVANCAQELTTCVSYFREPK